MVSVVATSAGANVERGHAPLEAGLIAGRVAAVVFGMRRQILDGTDVVWRCV